MMSKKIIEGSFYLEGCLNNFYITYLITNSVLELRSHACVILHFLT